MADTTHSSVTTAFLVEPTTPRSSKCSKGSSPTEPSAESPAAAVRTTAPLHLLRPGQDTDPERVVVQATLANRHPDVPYVCMEWEEESLRRETYAYLRRFGHILNFNDVEAVSPAPTLTVFVSFANPNHGLQAIRDNQALWGATVTIRGVTIRVLPTSPHLNLLRVNPEAALRGLCPGTSEGDTLIARYDRAMIRRLAPNGRGIDVLECYRPHQDLIPGRRIEYMFMFEGGSAAAFELLNRMNPEEREATKPYDGNTVIYDNIASGRDVRTTVMLRNIPNCIKQVDLIKLLNDIVPGLYDFVYLRIDFNNGCNVGYGFINFIRADFILDFIEAVVYVKWANSPKMAELKYATHQGVEALVSKFRNSAVMRQHPSARPKLFYSLIDNPYLVGYEQPFPDSDNTFKLHQSLQNQSSIGLYQTRTGVRGPAMIRKHTGFWDRGTTYDLQEQRRRALKTTYGPVHQTRFNDQTFSRFVDMHPEVRNHAQHQHTHQHHAQSSEN